MNLLKDITLILFLAILIILILAKFRIPSIIGFLLTGVLIGPSALSLVKSVSEIEILAEIGIILLMFTIGLEISIDKIKKMIKDFLFFGGLQVIFSSLVFFILLYCYGLSRYQAFLVGFILALSSTAIVLKLLQDTDDLNSPSGLKTTGILLFQDAIVVPAMLFVPFIGSFQETRSTLIITNILVSFGGVILIFVASKMLLPRIFNVILKVKIPELLTVSAFVFLFGVTMVAHQFDISLAIGAFIVGIAMSESEYTHQINVDVIPSKYLFNSIFFISIGMFVDISFLFTHLIEIVVVTIIIITLKISVILLIFIISRHPLNIGFLTAFSLAHIGEFSFILLKIVQKNAVLSQDIYQVLLSSAILSMFSIPFAIKIGKKISRHDKLKKELHITDQPKQKKHHTIIAGFGINGQNIARILKLLDISYAIVEMNHATVKKYKTAGEPIYYGNIDRKENMKFIGISSAALLVIAINDMDAAGRAITLARNLNHSLKIIVRANFLTQVDTLYAFGADLVLAQDMETSLVFIYHILKFYNMPDHISRIQTNLLRKEHYRFFFKKEARAAWKIAIAEFIEQDNELFFISPYSKHVSKKINDLHPFHDPDVKIIGVIRQNKILTQSLPNLILGKYDTIIFSGSHKNVFQAMTWMEENN
jgi:CPA2 family monovalent cation:H+ antiporter-2